MSGRAARESPGVGNEAPWVLMVVVIPECTRPGFVLEAPACERSRFRFRAGDLGCQRLACDPLAKDVRKDGSEDKYYLCGDHLRIYPSFSSRLELPTVTRARAHGPAEPLRDKIASSAATRHHPMGDLDTGHDLGARECEGAG